ncbi:MAG TPA: ABC transporter permease [Flavisolibacter sp.]
MNLLISLRSEILKTKRTASFYFTLGAACFGPFASMLDLAFDGVEPVNRPVILSKILVDKFDITGSMMMPIFIILACTLLSQIEYKNHTWKQVMATPQSKFNILLAKFVNVHLLIITFLVVNFLMMLLVAVILHFMEPSLDVLNQSINGMDVLMIRARGYVALLALTSIQFWLGLRFRNFIAPIGIGIGLWLAGTILVFEAKSGFAEYFPYSFHAFGVNEQFLPANDTYLLMSAVYAIVFLGVGYLDFRNRRMHG